MNILTLLRMWYWIAVGLTSLPVVFVLSVALWQVREFIPNIATFLVCCWLAWQAWRRCLSGFFTIPIGAEACATLAALDTLGEEPEEVAVLGPVTGEPILFGGIAAGVVPDAVVDDTPVVEVFKLSRPADYRRVAAKICCDVRLRMGAKPTPNAANRMVAWELCVKSCKARGISRNCDILRICTRAVDMVFIPNMYDVLAAEMRRDPVIQERLDAAHPQATFWQRMIGYEERGLHYGGGP
jgi:hypothetical protein